MPGTIDIAGLLALVRRGETVLFPTPGAAQDLKTRFDREQERQGLQSWEPARAFSWTAWTDALWSRLTLEGSDDRVLLNPLQENSLWAELIASHPEGRGLNYGSLQQLASLSRSALQLTGAHLTREQVHRLECHADRHDSRVFALWLKIFLERCEGERLLSRSLLEAALLDHTNSIAVSAPPPSVLHLAGFEQLTPAQMRLLERLRSGGTSVEVHRIRRPSQPDTLRRHVLAPNPREELRTALRWIGKQYGTRADPPAAIALVLPDPAGERPELEPLLRDILAPELEHVGADLSSTPWHFSAGGSLAMAPPIRHALLLLRWVEGELTLEDVGTLLLSPFFAGSDPLEARTRFETHTLRRELLLRPELSLAALLSLATKGARRNQAWAVHLPEFAEVHRLSGDGLRGQGSFADWAEFVRKLLRAAGWPGPRTPTAGQARATEAWEGLLDALATLDLWGQRLTYPEFLRKLVEQASAVPAPEATTQAPVEILRLAETEGRSFDAVVLLRATDANLPLPERPHPLLGLELQRNLRLAGSDLAVAYARTRERLQSLAERSGHLLLFAAAADENGPLRPSTLIGDLGLTILPAADLLPPSAPEDSVVLQGVVESASRLPLSAFNVTGGARLLELQAACGFHAFAALRLQADVPQVKPLGMDARARGNLLHDALFELWTEIKSQAALRVLGQDERTSILQRCIRRAVEKQRIATHPIDTWSQTFVELAERRLQRLLNDWLDFELQRGDFTVVSSEKERTVQVGPFELKVRPDRTDRVEGGLVLVDYKSSSNLSAQHWLGERPEAPQLPLYTLLEEPEQIRGLAFARIRPGKQMSWIGLQKERGDLRDHGSIKLHDLAGQVAAWREELNRLAEEFAAGDAATNPKAFPSSCTYCAQRPLCRIGASPHPDSVITAYGGEVSGG